MLVFVTEFLLTLGHKYAQTLVDTYVPCFVQSGRNKFFIIVILVPPQLRRRQPLQSHRTHHTRFTTIFRVCVVLLLFINSCSGMGVLQPICLTVDSCGHIQFNHRTVANNVEEVKIKLHSLSREHSHEALKEKPLQLTALQRIINIHEMHNTLLSENCSITHPNSDEMRNRSSFFTIRWLFGLSTKSLLLRIIQINRRISGTNSTHRNQQLFQIHQNDHRNEQHQ